MLRFPSFPIWLALGWAPLSGGYHSSDDASLESSNPSVVLSELLPIPIGPVEGQVLLAGEQHVLVLYPNADGQWLHGYELAEIRLSPGLELCEEERGPLGHYCLSIPEGGEHVLEVTVGEAHFVLPFEAVSESDIVEVEVLQADEHELEPGTWVHIDVVGVTEDGTHVSSLHPRFTTDQVPYLGYFAYQYDPEEPSRWLEIEVLGETYWTKFRGTTSSVTAHK